MIWQLFFLCFMLFSGPLWAQSNIPIGTWRTHFSFRDAHSIALTANGAYCAGSNSLFFFDFDDGSLNKLSRIDGLSDSEITTIAYHHQLEVLIIAYDNGNLDLLSNSGITNINTIERSTIGPSKGISHITFNQNIAYLSVDFGVVILDLISEEVMEAYTNIGDNGEVIKVNYGTVASDTLFLATDFGVIAGSLDPALNLQDYKNWKRFDPGMGIPKTAISTVGSNETHLLATIDNMGIYSYNQGVWNLVNHNLNQSVLHITSGTSPLVLTASNKLLSVNSDLEVSELVDPIFPKPQASALNGSGMWVADSLNSLILPVPGGFDNVFPSGPFSDSINRVFHLNDRMVALPPGYDNSRIPLRSALGFYTFHDGQWTSYNSSNQSETLDFPEIRDLVDACYSSQSQKFYFASFGEGIIEWNPGATVKILDETTPGSTLMNIIPGGRNVFISSLQADSQGDIWATNYGNPAPIHRLNPTDESWTEFTVDAPAGRFPLDLSIAGNGDLWLRLDPNNGGGILVYNPESLAQKHLTDLDNLGGLPTLRVLALEIDRIGQVWLGTDQGIWQYPFPFDVLENPQVNANPVLIEGRPLLQGEPVTCIAVDGGNRKWIGTENGIWLVSEFGDRIINNFTKQNSPLPSNEILDVAVDGKSGEVFITTEAGLISYRGTSTKANVKHEHVQIFPNPVTGEFTGIVGISGLAEDAIVKITDITGKLVDELVAAGGTAVWEVNDLQGRRVGTGVYLVFSSSANGEETFIGKIAVIN